MLRYTIEKNLFHLIKINTLNFKNCISCLYLNVYNQVLEKEYVKEICVNFLINLDLDQINSSERLIIKSIERWCEI